jgi:hypothetical protein
MRIHVAIASAIACSVVLSLDAQDSKGLVRSKHLEEIIVTTRYREENLQGFPWLFR